MLTPEFKLCQNDQYVVITLKLRHAKISEVEVYIDGPEFRFYMKPYYLRLFLPGDLVEDGREKASYDIDRGEMVVHAPKANQGEWFDGLDMLTALIAPPRSQQWSRPSIEEIGEKLEETGLEDSDNDDDNDDDWFIEQELPQDQSSILAGVKYGFANRLSDFFAHCEDFGEVVDVPDPDCTPATERRRLRLADEQKKFNPEHYLYDLYDNDDIERLLQYQPPYCQLASQHRVQTLSGVSGNAAASSVEPGECPSLLVKFSDDEKKRMRRLPNRQYLLDTREERAAYFNLVDVMFCYAYNHRITEGENSVESPWTVGKLSPSLCWLDSFSSLSDVVIACCRRSLIYPLYCHFKLTQTVLVDLQTIFYLGRRQIVKCLLELHHMIERDDLRLFLNDLYITDLCVWAQRTSHRRLRKIAEHLQFQLKMSDVALDLEELETTARQAIAEVGSSLDGNDQEAECQSSSSDSDSDSGGSDSDSGGSDSDSGGSDSSENTFDNRT